MFRCSKTNFNVKIIQKYCRHTAFWATVYLRQVWIWVWSNKKHGRQVTILKIQYLSVIPTLWTWQLGQKWSDLFHIGSAHTKGKYLSKVQIWVWSNKKDDRQVAILTKEYLSVIQSDLVQFSIYISVKQDLILNLANLGHWLSCLFSKNTYCTG